MRKKLSGRKKLIGLLVGTLIAGGGAVAISAGAAHADGWYIHATYPSQKECIASGDFLKWTHHPHIPYYKCTYDSGKGWHLWVNVVD